MKNLKDYIYKSIFASCVKCIADEDKDVFLAKASIDELKNIIPNTVLGKNSYDLFPFAGNVALINARNLNGDAMSGSVCLKIMDTLLNKYVDIEHKRNLVIGHVVSIGLSKFNTNYRTGLGSEIIKPEDIKDTNEPFNLSCGSVLYRVITPDTLIDDIIASNDPQNKEKYLSISQSWEVLFRNFSIAKSPTIYLKDAEIYKEGDKEFELLSPYLQANGGSGMKENQYIFRVIDDEPIFLGLGLTDSAASQVQGIVIPNEEKPQEPNNSSNSSNLSVNITDNNLKQENTMTVKVNDKQITIAAITDLTDENLKLITAATVQEFVADEIKKASEQYVKDRDAKENAIKTIEAKNKEMEAKSNELAEKLTKATEQLTNLSNQIAAQQSQEDFNKRMALFDEEYDLTDEDRQILASDIKGLNEESFAAFQKKMGVLLKNKKKGSKAECKDMDKNMDKNMDKDAKASIAVASTVVVDPSLATTTTATTVVNDAIANAVVDPIKVPNTATTAPTTLFDKYKEAFDINKGFTYQGNRRK